ncbi:hypothetical protein N431DRAFT_386647 [Stipitochalara longipes BDJ]|nr:hypothetical protein N431DRAFT_386647 [Stipitochalara longipes BDJ]
MVQLTVGYVAGFIAAGMFIARLWSPNIITFILSGLLGDKNSAATWTVAGRLFQKSYWPWILQDDTSYNNGVPRRILFLSRLMMLLGGLISIAAVLTPLGLYQTLAPGKVTSASFKSIKDKSPFGYATPPRGNATFSRVCSNALDAYPDTSNLVPRPCPFTSTEEVVVWSPTNVSYKYPSSYDLNIPQVITDIYSSGTEDVTTVSNYFDIQWRQYLTVNNTDYNNNSLYTVGTFRNMDSVLLDNKYEPIEGLIVDTVKGSIGFRSHTIPDGFPNGVTWQEDILFIGPETVCVDTNLTLDFSINNDPSKDIFISDLVLTDRGGFAKLNPAVPTFDRSDPQKNPDLYGRAYQAAWQSNALTALYYNVVEPFNYTDSMKPLSAVNSFVGKTYSISGITYFSTSPNTLTINPDFGFYLGELYEDAPSGNASQPAPSDSGVPTNPFNVSRSMFGSINIACQTSGKKDPANITNLYMACGQIYGVPQRQDGGNQLLPDSGSTWSQPIYSCASAVKATIKTVSFTYNGTEDVLTNLVIPDIKEKIYADKESMPLWGVENTDGRYENSGINLIWGLVSPEYENNPNVSTVRQESLYLPGFYFSPVTTQLPIFEDNLPGSEFYAGSMDTTWTVPGSSLGSGIDYSGSSNIAVWARWQNLSLSAETVSLIPNLIFTDNAASAVVGTKGVLGPMNAAKTSVVPIQVTPIVQKIRYHYPFAIPAFIAAFILLALSVGGIVLAVLGKRMERLRVHLWRVSPGRIFTAFLYPEGDTFMLKSKEWSEKKGALLVDLSSDVVKPASALKPIMVVQAKPEPDVTESERLDDEAVEVENNDAVSVDSREQA